MKKVIYILGAGFSKSANAPLQSEIISEIFKLNSNDLSIDIHNIFIDYRNDFKLFLTDTMYVEDNNFKKVNLEDIYTPIDRCIIDNLSFRNISPKDLIDLRQKINGLIIIMLRHKLRNAGAAINHINDFSNYLIKYKRSSKNNDSFAIISTNWDILVDNSLKSYIASNEGVVDYCCYTTSYDNREPVMPSLLAKGKGMFNIKLLKLHGSMNWLHCKRCQRLFVTFFEKIALDEYVNKPICRLCERNFKNEHTSDGGSYLSSQLVMPTFLKDFSNVQLKLIWQNAGVELAEASKIVFLGYSFPMADFELRQLLARNVRHTAEIEVVLHRNDKPKSSDVTSTAEYRYKSFFGKRNITVHYQGVEKYIQGLISMDKHSVAKNSGATR